MLSIFKRGAAVVLASFVAVSAFSVPAFAANYKTIYIENKCPSTIEVWIRYSYAVGEWRTKGYWTISGNKTIRLASNNKLLYHRSGADFLIYAHKKYLTTYQWKGSDYRKYRGVNYPMMTLEQGDYNEYPTSIRIGLTCKNS